MKLIKSSEVKAILDAEFNNSEFWEALYLITKMVYHVTDWNRVFARNFYSIYETKFNEFRNKIGEFLTKYKAIEYYYNNALGKQLAHISSGVLLTDVNKNFISFIEEYLQSHYPQLKELVIFRYKQLPEDQKTVVEDFCKNYKERRTPYKVWYYSNKYMEIYEVLLKIGLVRINDMEITRPRSVSNYIHEEDMIPEYINPEEILESEGEKPRVLEPISESEKAMEIVDIQLKKEKSIHEKITDYILKREKAYLEEQIKFKQMSKKLQIDKDELIKILEEFCIKNESWAIDDKKIFRTQKGGYYLAYLTEKMGGGFKFGFHNIEVGAEWKKKEFELKCSKCGNNKDFRFPPLFNQDGCLICEKCQRILQIPKFEKYLSN